MDACERTTPKHASEAKNGLLRRPKRTIYMAYYEGRNDIQAATATRYTTQTYRALRPFDVARFQLHTELLPLRTRQAAHAVSASVRLGVSIKVESHARVDAPWKQYRLTRCGAHGLRVFAPPAHRRLHSVTDVKKSKPCPHITLVRSVTIAVCVWGGGGWHVCVGGTW